jgi:hypothetical protein
VDNADATVVGIAAVCVGSLVAVVRWFMSRMDRRDTQMDRLIDNFERLVKEEAKTHDAILSELAAIKVAVTTIHHPSAPNPRATG